MIKGPMELAKIRSRDGGVISSRLLAHYCTCRFDHGREISYNGRLRRFGLGIYQGPWKVYLTLWADVYEDLIEYLRRESGREPVEADVMQALKDKKLQNVPPLIAFRHDGGLEPKIDCEEGAGYCFLQARKYGWSWKTPQSVKLLAKTLDAIQGRKKGGKKR